MDPVGFEKSHVHEVYSEIADHFSSTRYKPWPHVLKFLNSLPCGSIGVDLGCGNGKNMSTNKNIFTMGTDQCEQLLYHAIKNKRTCHGDVLRGCILAPIFRPASVDFCLSIATIHHLATEERRVHAILEISRLLRRGGQALIYVWALNNDDQHVHSTKFLSMTNSGETMISWNAPSGQTYYHLFQEGELDQLVAKVPSLQLRLLGRDAGNLYAIVEKFALSLRITVDLLSPAFPVPRSQLKQSADYKYSTNIYIKLPKRPNGISPRDDNHMGIIVNDSNISTSIALHREESRDICHTPSTKRGDSIQGKFFRSRKIDFNKEIAVLLESSEPEEHLAQMRSVPLVLTGVDKEEEEETHLKTILATAPTFSRVCGEAARIPVPEASEMSDSISTELYTQLYPATGKAFKKGTRWSAPDPPSLLDPINNPFFSNHGHAGLYCQNNLLGFGYGSRSPVIVLPTDRKRTGFVPYCATADDLEFLVSQKPSMDVGIFEKMMWVLESIALVFGVEVSSSTPNFLSLKEASVFIDRWLDPQELVIANLMQNQVSKHWRLRRESFSPSLSLPLIPTLKHEDSQVKTNATHIDPYVCFRRREVRQPRKTRKADMDALLKLSRLQEQFEDLLFLLRLVLQRDQLKKSLLSESGLIFGHTWLLESLKNKFGINVPPIVFPSEPHNLQLSYVYPKELQSSQLYSGSYGRKNVSIHV